MSGSRWKYRTATVTVGDNSVDVRQLTVGERQAFAELSKQAKNAGVEVNKLDLPKKIARFGITTEGVSEADINEMPADLLDATVRKIFELSGIDLADDDTPEKKETATAH